MNPPIYNCAIVQYILICTSKYLLFFVFYLFIYLQAANMVQGIDRIAGQMGYLVVNSEGAVVAVS